MYIIHVYQDRLAYVLLCCVAFVRLFIHLFKGWGLTDGLSTELRWSKNVGCSTTFMS